MRGDIHSGLMWQPEPWKFKNFNFDTWGDIVNTTSRIEYYGKVGKVNISETTYSYLIDDLQCIFEEKNSVEVMGF